ncbi:MAG: SRPBCC domain-containing protein [Acidimicrobiales bacterium]
MTTRHPTRHARAGDTVLTFSREFDAPAALVQRAHVEAELFVQWMGPAGTACEIHRFDAVTGGAFDYTIHGGGQGFRFVGSYHEISPGRIVHTWEYLGDPGRPTLESVAFVDLPDGRSRIDGTSVYTSTEHCAEMADFDESGEGMDENFTRLDALLATLPA